MRSRTRLLFSFLAAFCVAVSPTVVQAGITYNETIDGDLSGDRLNPTSLIFSLGINTISATSVQGDREYIHVVIPLGLELAAATLTSYAGDDDTAFIAIQAGNVLSEPPSGTDVTNLLGWSHFGPGVGNVGLDILPDIGTGPGAIGFVPPLSAGDYTLWMQQTGTSPATYTFEFTVTPEPATAFLLMTGSFLAIRRRR